MKKEQELYSRLTNNEKFKNQNKKKLCLKLRKLLFMVQINGQI